MPLDQGVPVARVHTTTAATGKESPGVVCGTFLSSWRVQPMSTVAVVEDAELVGVQKTLTPV